MSERDEAKADGARLQANSGRGQHRKGDAVLDGAMCKYVIDYKEYGKGFRITPAIWAKLNTDAWKVDTEAEGVLKLVIGETNPIRVGVVDWDHFLALQDRIAELELYVEEIEEVIAAMPIDIDDFLGR